MFKISNKIAIELAKIDLPLTISVNAPNIKKTELRRAYTILTVGGLKYNIIGPC